MSLKDKGNQCFKNGQYEQAIKLYELYVEGEHQDNKQAYCNMSLCYFRLQQYQSSVEAAESALEEDRYFAKSYYRLVNANKQIPGRQYQVFINSALFLKNFQTLDQQREKVSTIFKEQREKLQYAIKNEGKMKINANIINSISEAQQKHETDSSIKGQIQKAQINWFNGTLEQKMKWEQIIQITASNYAQGVNLAYCYLNQILNSNKRAEVLQKIRKLKQQESNRAKISKLNSVQQPIQIESSNQPLNTDKQRQSQSKNSPIHGTITIKKQKQQQKIHNRVEKTTEHELAQNVMDQVQKIEERTDLQQMKTAESALSQDVVPEVQKTEKQPDLQQIPTKQYTLSTFGRYFQNIQNARQIFSYIYDSIVKLLNSEESSLTKKEVLSSLKIQRKDIKIIFKSYNKKQKQQIKQLLSLSHIDQNFLF